MLYYQPSFWNLDGGDNQYCSKGNQQDIIDKLNQDTTTVYVERPQIILPHDQKGKLRMLEQTADNQYLHILMPYKDLNILNAPGFDHTMNMSKHDSMMVEIGCKIFEVNHLHQPSPTSLNVSGIVTA